MEIKANSTWINKKNGREYEVIKEVLIALMKEMD